MLEHLCDVKITAYTERAAGISISKVDFSQIEQNALRAPDNEAAAKMNEKIEEIRKNSDSAGGIVACRITGIPAGLGEPVFGKLDAELAKAILSVGAVKGIEFGAGFAVAKLTGSQNNDDILNANGITRTNNAGGINGGISNGNDIVFRVAVKPTPSISLPQKTYNFETKNVEELIIQGRHDLCIALRVPPIIEAATAIALADLSMICKRK